MVAKRRRMRTAVEDRLVRFFCCPHKLRPASPSAWRGTAFDCCRSHRMIARKILALLNVVQQAAPGNVSTRGLSERCSIIRSKRRHCRLWPHQETFAGAACQPRKLSGPTHAEPGRPNVPAASVQLRTVKSGSPPGAASVPAHRDLDAVLNNRGDLLYAVFDLLLADAAVTKDEAPSLRGSLIAG